jgi:hypothetical protein
LCRACTARLGWWLARSLVRGHLQLPLSSDSNGVLVVFESAYKLLIILLHTHPNAHTQMHMHAYIRTSSMHHERKRTHTLICSVHASQDSSKIVLRGLLHPPPQPLLAQLSVMLLMALLHGALSPAQQHPEPPTLPPLPPAGTPADDAQPVAAGQAMQEDKGSPSVPSPTLPPTGPARGHRAPCSLDLAVPLRVCSHQLNGLVSLYFPLCGCLVT